MPFLCLGYWLAPKSQVLRIKLMITVMGALILGQAVDQALRECSLSVPEVALEGRHYTYLCFVEVAQGTAVLFLSRRHSK